jgi:hypothetical protein
MDEGGGGLMSTWSVDAPVDHAPVDSRHVSMLHSLTPLRVDQSKLQQHLSNYTSPTTRCVVDLRVYSQRCCLQAPEYSRLLSADMANTPEYFCATSP